MDLSDFGALQLRVLEMLWEREQASAAEICEAWAPETAPAYTTVLSALQKLFRRKLVRRRKRGRAHVYKPRIEREAFRRRFVEEIRNKYFGGSTSGLVAALVGDEAVSDDELAEIESVLKDRLSQRRARGRRGDR